MAGGTATLKIGADTTEAKRGIAELGDAVKKLNTKKGNSTLGKKVPESVQNANRAAAASKAGGGDGGLMPSFAGLGKEALKLTGIIGAVGTAFATLKDIDIFKNWAAEMKAGIKGLTNPGEGADIALDDIGAIADKGRQYRMSAKDTKATMAAMQTTFGTDKGAAMLEKADTYVSQALVNGGQPLKQLMNDFKLEESQVDSMAGMNARERFEFLMQSASKLKTPDEAAAALVPVLGAKNVGEAKGNISEYANYQANRQRYLGMSSALDDDKVKRAENWGDELDFARYGTWNEQHEVSPYQSYKTIENERSKTAAAANFNAKADDRGRWFGGADEAAAHYTNNIEKPLNKQDYQQGVSTLAAAIKTGPNQPATNDKGGATFQ